jgi:hypothetical protein
VAVAFVYSLRGGEFSLISPPRYTLVLRSDTISNWRT